MSVVAEILRNFKNDESGQDMIEYCLVAGLIGLTTISATTSLADSIVSTFLGFGDTLSSAI
jgi:pilus assembly protein Flp/PilA